MVTGSEHAYMNEMIRAVGRVEGKLDLLVEALVEQKARSGELSRQVNMARGGLAALGFIFSGTTLYSFLHIFK